MTSIRRQNPTTEGKLPRSMARPSLVSFVCLSTEELVKLAESIEMPFWVVDLSGPRNHVGLLHGVQVTHGKRHFRARAANCKVYRDYSLS